MNRLLINKHPTTLNNICELEPIPIYEVTDIMDSILNKYELKRLKKIDEYKMLGVKNEI